MNTKEAKKILSKYLREIGKRGGSKNTPKQIAARKIPKRGAGRPRKVRP
jgi:hypothetical protein